MKIASILKTYDDEVKLAVEYNLVVDDDGITFSLAEDHLHRADGTIERTDCQRAVKIELRPDGALNVLLYPTDVEEPKHFRLNLNGSVEMVE